MRQRLDVSLRTERPASLGHFFRFVDGLLVGFDSDLNRLILTIITSPRRDAPPLVDAGIYQVMYFAVQRTFKAAYFEIFN